MAKVVKLRRSVVDDVIEAGVADDLEEILVVGKTREGVYVTYENDSCSLETAALGAQLMQAQVMVNCGRLLGPDEE